METDCTLAYIKPPRIFFQSIDVSNRTMSLQSNDRYMVVNCKSEYPVEWSINQRVITSNPRMKIIKDGLYLCRAKTMTHYSRLSYLKVRLPQRVKPTMNLTSSTTTIALTSTIMSTQTSTVKSTAKSTTTHTTTSTSTTTTTSKENNLLKTTEL